MLVDDPSDAQLGPLVRGLSLDFPDLWVITEAARMDDAPQGAVIVLVARHEDATWLNLNRPILADRAFKVVLWCKRAVSEHLVKKAPDFFNWISRRFECPAGPPEFAVQGLQAALRARAWAVDFRGRGLDEVFAAALPKRKLIRVSASAPDEVLEKAAKEAGPAWIAWTNLFDERGVMRVRRIVNGAHRRGRNILENARGTAPEAWPVFDALMNVSQAIGALERAGLPAAGRLAAMLELEPEAITLAAEELARGVAVADIVTAIRNAADPGAALAKRAEEALALDPVQVAAYRAAPPVLRAFAMDPRVRQARAVIVGHTGATLPPLTEKIPQDADGGMEFERLLRQLLPIYAGQRRLHLSTTHKLDAGSNAIMPDGLPDMPGTVAFWFHWPDIDSYEIRQTFQDAAKDKKIAHWVVVTPYDLATFQDELPALPWRSPTISNYTWDHTWIEQLLRKCPPLLARYYPEEARAYLPGYDGTDFGTLATRYRRKLTSFHDRLKTFGIPPEARPRESRIELPLAELFIPLRLVPEKNNAESLNFARALSESKNGVVLADPGMGKSTLLAYLALVFAGGVPFPGFTPTPRTVPMHISLRDFVRRQKQQPGLSFLDYLEIDARERFGLSSMHRAFFEATLRMGEAVVLLDGLDEVGNETARHALAAYIRAFQAEYPESRFWVTSRIYGYTENVRLPETFDHYRIARLDDTQINDFVTRWYEHQIGEPQEAAAQAKSLQAAIRRTPGVKRLAGNPLLLTLMAFIHQGLRRLPKDRGELYDKCIDMLLKTWEEAKVGDGENPRSIKGLALNESTQKDYLAHLAFFIQQKNQGGEDEEARGLVSRREAVDALARRHLVRARRERPELTDIEARDEMSTFLDYVCDGTGLLLDRGNDQISFIHLSFQEYLAAWVFLCGTDLPKGPEFFLEHLGDPAWEEVLLLRLYIVLLGGGGGEAEFDQIVGAILRALERKSSPEGWLTLVRAIRDDLEFREGDRKEILRRAIGFWLQAPAFPGTWFESLEEVRLFGERTRDILRKLIAEMRIQAREPGEVIHLLRLESFLYAFPNDAVEWLQRRSDLPDLLVDLIFFFDEEPSIQPLLAKHAKQIDLVRGVGIRDWAFIYRVTVRWMVNPPSVAATEAATAVLWNRILTKSPRVAPNDSSSFNQTRLKLVESATSAWERHCKTLTNPSGLTAALVIANAAFATLFTGCEYKLPFPPDIRDPFVHFSHLLYERCISRNPETNADAIKHVLANPAPELRPLLEAVDLIKPTHAASETVRPTVTTESPAPKESPKEHVLFSWIHLSDMHFGHRNTSHQWDQKLVLDSLHRDITRLNERDIPTPECILLTGDIAFSGSTEQYADAAVWLDKVASTLAITRDRIFVVPGNHDVDRNVDRKDRNVARLIRGLRDGDDLVDDILENADDRALLASRLAAYLAFAAGYPSVQAPDPLFWAHAFVSTHGLPVRIIGLPTALLAAGDIDHGKLRLGKKPLASTLNDAHKDRELVLVLTHHPLRGGWLADQRDTDSWVQSRAHVHLFGHVHESDSEFARSGSGAGILRIAAGAVHGDVLPPGIPASHGYSVGTVIANAEGKLRLRIWPRLWSEQNKEFRVDVNNVPEGQPYAEHSLDGRLRFEASPKS
ncbi:MAG: metallophosphoesterase [Polyangiaceae bacterium]|nr:metallophosphoesterase [Polyangiaceae bacterium]